MSPYEREMWDFANATAAHSKDPSTKVGAVAALNKRVKGTGRNGFPPKIPDRESLYDNRALKLLLTAHAESNLISSNDGSLVGCDLFVTFPPCNDCAKQIIASGITRIFTKKYNNKSSEWFYRYQLAKVMFDLVGIEVFELCDETGQFEVSKINYFDFESYHGVDMLERASNALQTFLKCGV